jgi:hypothetical protein
VTPAGSRSFQSRRADPAPPEPGHGVGCFSEHRFSNDGMHGLPLNLILESFGVLGGRRAVDPDRRPRQASAAGRFNGFVMGLR